jgi:intraflagellar transport protein 172
VRDWVLEMCTSSDIDQQLPSAADARGTLYEGLYASDRPTCIATGFPVHAVDMLQANGSVANKRDWNAYVTKTKRDPWTDRAEKPRY